MNIQISDSQYWKKLNINDMKFIIDFIVIDDYTDWRLPKYEDIVKMVPLINNDGDEIYVPGMLSNRLKLKIASSVMMQ